MAEYIEREAAIDEIEGTTWYHISCQKNLVEGAACEADALYKATDIYNVIKSAPTADVVEVRHGKWIETQEPLGWCDVDCAECSVCHESWIMDEDSSIDDYECMWHYCPHCGAKMDGGTNDDSKKSVRASE